MNLDEYLSLTPEEQWDELWDRGRFLSNYINIEVTFQLYTLYDFFVEVELCRTADKIVGKNIFLYGGNLEKYLLADH